MDTALLSGDHVASREQARKFASGFGRRAVCHVIIWLVFFALALKGLSKLDEYSITTMILKIILGLLGFYFSLVLLGLYLRCKGQKPVDLAAIEKDGGSYVVTPTGRTVEYFVYGSQRSDATVAVLIHGQAGTGRGFKEYFYPHEVMERLNVKAIAPSLPGHGYTDADPNRRIALWPHDDLEPILERENVKQFMVQGWSYGTAHAMAAASYFGADRCVAMGLICPYLCRDVCRELGLKTDADMVFTEKGADSPSVAPIYALLGLSWNQTLAKGANFIADTKIAAKEEPELLAAFETDVRRGAVRGVAPQIPELVNQETNQVWQDPRTIRTRNIAVWYAKDDAQVPPEHGKWLAEIFEARKSEGVKCSNRAEDYQWGHFSYVKKSEIQDGIMTKTLLELMQA